MTANRSRQHVGYAKWGEYDSQADRSVGHSFLCGFGHPYMLGHVTLNIRLDFSLVRVRELTPVLLEVFLLILRLCHCVVG